jgi:hypothetical protein
MAIPPQVLYDTVKPIGYPTTTKIMRFSPQTGQNNIQPNDIVRFNFSTNGYWDPSTVYIALTVQLDPSYRRFDAFQIDGSASSFISEFIATCKGVELERIQEYDQLANFLEDINYSNEQRFSKDIQGLGNNSRASTKSIGSTPTQAFIPRLEGEFQSITSLAAPKFFHQGWNPFNCPMTNNPNNDNILYDNTNANLKFNANKLVSPGLVVSNIIRGLNTAETVNSWIPQLVLFKNLFGLSGPIVGNLNGSSAGALGYGLLGYEGFQDALNNDLTQGCFEPALCRSLGQPTMIDGLLQHEACEKRTFAIPLYSGIFGQLMEKNDLKYLPMSALQDLMLEFRINPNAIFTSGYSYLQANTDTLETSYTVAATTHLELQRKFIISKFEIVCEMLFFDARVDTLIQNQLNSSDGVVFPTQSWMLGPIISIPAGQTPNGNYQLNMGFESLKKICITFLPPTNKSYLRKLYRVSAGVTSIQLRIGMDLYPSYAIKGHSGTAGGFPSTYAWENNNEYLIALYKAFGKFNNIDEDCSINAVNFAVNSRWHSSASIPNTAPYISDVDRRLSTVNFSNQTFGLSLLYENLCKGKAIYAIDLEGLGDDKRVTSGLNTTINKPLEIIFTSDSGSAYKTTGGTTQQINMYIWCHYDMVVKFGKFNAQVLGRGL